ncbi:MAG TPA: tail fiber domain-containing protein [Pyrinomonadaceae bacterium]|nr:tail fiber domain-containing protein [Pyrinomonadaceae bacterium]
MPLKSALRKLLLLSLLVVAASPAALAQGTSFTYQGRLADGGSPPTGTYELEFKLFDAPSGGTQQPQPSPVTIQFTGASAVAVTGGVFTVQLDFGADAFPGAARYLEIGVRHVGDPAFTTLAPRQPVSSTPYAIRSASAATAADFSGGLAGDVTGTQSATVVSSVGGQSAATVAGGAAAANAATNDNTAGAIVKRDASGNFSAGTITAALNGNASTATSAASAANFSGSLAGDVTGTQAATTVVSVGGQSAATVASGAAAANNAASANTPGAIVARDASGNFSAGTITASLNGNASTATTAASATTAATASSVSAAAGDSVVAAINAGSSSVNTANVGGDVELAPSAQQTTNSTNHLINLKLVSTDPVNHKLGTPGANSLLSLSASGTYPDNSVHDKERFRVDNDGSILSVADYTGGINTTAPIEGSGTRFMWYATKAALRAGQINGTQWDDANIGLYSTAFGENVRALGDNAIVVGKNSVAANTGTVALGEGHTATGANSVALGYGASTSTINGSPRTGTFVFSDRSVPLTYTFNSTSPDIESQFHPTVTNSFNVRAVNGSFFYTNTALTTGFIFNSTTATMTLANSKLSMASDGSTTLTSNSGGSAGVTLPAGGGSWNNLSDRNMKANFAAVDARAILRGVLSLPISTWNYKAQGASVRHIGPMAQDFFATFKLGEGDKTISTIDPDGVALAAIQGLHEEIKDRDARIDGLQQRVTRQQGEIDALKQLVCQDHPEAAVCKEGR